MVDPSRSTTSAAATVAELLTATHRLMRGRRRRPCLMVWYSVFPQPSCDQARMRAGRGGGTLGECSRMPFTGTRSGARFAGRLDLEPGYAQLAGRTAHGGRTLLRVPFLDIVDVRYGNGRLRVDGSPGRRSRSAASTARPHFTSSRIGCKSAALPV